MGASTWKFGGYCLAARLVALCLFIGPDASYAENWPQWRGLSNNGLSSAKNLPDTWDQETNLAWRLPLPGAAGATPVIWKDKIFLTSSAEQDLVLICISTQGKELWRRTVASGNRPVHGSDQTGEGNSASPSPTTDGKYVWAMMGTGKLACFDFDGEEIWKLDLQEKYGKFQIQFGMASTPALDGDTLYVQLLHNAGAVVAALDKATGQEKWRIDRKSDAIEECKDSYASPIVYRDAEQAFLITHGADYTIGHDLTDGTELWRLGGLNGAGQQYNPTLRFVASPVAVPGLIVVPSAKNGPVVALRPKKAGDLTNDFLWKMPRNTPDVPSPLIHDGLVYLCREQGTLIVLDAESGEKLYEERIHEFNHRASPVAADGKLYLSGRDGTVNVIKLGRTYQRLATNKFDEPLAASPAIADGVIYFRTFKALYAVRSRE
ncbi:MAG: PQQ-binding-like beta-propeller repeat protein [Pirellulales bacterium]|nr:PQQ-binding-like beta-propeller repeat protein [Pirellulales bacterium]